MISKSLIQFSIDGWGCVPSLFDLRPNYGRCNENNGDHLQKVPCIHCHTQCPQSCRRPLPTHASTGDSGLVSCGVAAPFSWVLVPQGSVCALQQAVSPVLWKFWQLYGGVNGDLLQKGLCHTQVCCTQSPYPCGRPLMLKLRYFGHLM